MAKAIATCTCKTCGATFEKTTDAGLEVKNSISGLDLLAMAGSKKQEQVGGDS